MQRWMGNGRLDVSEASDLRRRRTRDVTEIIRERGRLLDPDERALLETVYAGGQSAASVARLVGRSPKHVRLRLRRLVARVLSPEFALVAACGELWSLTRRRVALACVVRGHSLRQAADELNLSLHDVRRHRLAVAALAEAASRARAPGAAA